MSGYGGPLASDSGSGGGNDGGGNDKKGKGDFKGGGTVPDKYSVQPSDLHKGQHVVVDNVTRDAVTGPHSKETAEQIAKQYAQSPNPMRHEPDYGRSDPNKGVGVSGRGSAVSERGKGDSGTTGGGTNVKDGNWEPNN